MNFKYTHIKGFVGVCLLTMGLASCTSGYEDINRNQLLPTKDDEKKDGVIYGAYLPSFEKAVIPIGTQSDNTVPVNKYQIGVNLAGDAWAGYMAARENKFNGGNNFTTYFMYNSWVNGVYSYMTKDVFTPWMKFKEQTGGKGEIFALAQILKIAAMHRSTDTFGPIPYSQIGNGLFEVAYDMQENVYRSFFTELESAIQSLTEYSKTNSKILADFDIVYEGDVDKWIRYANSLMLRLAIRVRYVDESLARKYAEMAVSHSKGLIESPEQAARMGKGAGLQMRNPLKVINIEYNDTRMGATIYSYLNGYNDPRLNAYFTPTEDEQNLGIYHAVRSGLADYNNDYGKCSRPKVEADTPLYWMKASEVCFLKAEGALAGFNMKGTPEAFYNAGIRMSFQENAVSGADAYIVDRNSKPANFVDKIHSVLSCEAPGTLSIAWDNAATDEIKLERIITQKYLAIFPDGQEAWTEWRRTGYPRQIVVKVNKTNSNVQTGNGTNLGVRRLPYPQSEYNQNNSNVSAAVNAAFNGNDNASVNLWWDKKIK